MAHLFTANGMTDAGVKGPVEAALAAALVLFGNAKSWWDLVVLGTTAAGSTFGVGTGIALVLGAIGAQIVHAVLLRRATRGAAHPGAALIVISFVVGYELYGVGGSVVGSCVTIFVAALLDSIAQEEREEVPIPASMTTLEETT